MPRNGGAAGMLMMRSRAQTSRRTVHHTNHNQNNNSASSSFDEAELALPPNASISEHLEMQFRAGISRYMFVVDIDSRHFKEFCKKFAESPLELSKKIEMINEVIQLIKYDHVRLCSLISFLPAACVTLTEFTEFILPLYNQEMAILNSTPQTYYHHPPQKYILEDLLKTITHSLIDKLAPADLYAIFKLKINNKSIIQWIYQSDDFSGNMMKTIEAIEKSIKACNQKQLADAITILTSRIRDHKQLEHDQYHDVSIFILSSLFWALSKTQNPKAVFDLAKEYPITKKSDYILKHIAFCIFALSAGIPRKEVKVEIQKLFTMPSKSKAVPFMKVKEASRGKAIFDLIDAKLLPRDYVISSDDKELVFDHILKKIPEEKRISLLTDLIIHSQTTLNKFLWPQPGRFGIFSSERKLPERWVIEINKVINAEQNLADQEQEQQARPGT